MYLEVLFLGELSISFKFYSIKNWTKLNHSIPLITPFHSVGENCNIHTIYYATNVRFGSIADFEKHYESFDLWRQTTIPRITPMTKVINNAGQISNKSNLMSQLLGIVVSYIK